MYIVVRKKQNLKSNIIMTELSGILFGTTKKVYKINDVNISNLIIYHKKLAYQIALEQVNKKFKKLMLILPELLISDDEDGEALRQALNHIERFRQIIKNKYRKYLKQKDLETMSKQLMILQKEAETRFIEIQNNKYMTNTKGSCK